MNILQDRQLNPKGRLGDFDLGSVQLDSDDDGIGPSSSLTNSLDFNTDTNFDMPHHTFSMPLDHTHLSMARVACVQPRISNTLPVLDRDLPGDLASRVVDTESSDDSDDQYPNDNCGHYTDV